MTSNIVPNMCVKEGTSSIFTEVCVSVPPAVPRRHERPGGGRGVPVQEGQEGERARGEPGRPAAPAASRARCAERGEASASQEALWRQNNSKISQGTGKMFIIVTSETLVSLINQSTVCFQFLLNHSSIILNKYPCNKKKI